MQETSETDPVESQSEDCNHSTEVCLNSKEVLKASLEAAERQVLELRCSLDECERKLKAAEMRALDLHSANLQQQEELIESMSRIFSLQEQLSQRQSLALPSELNTHSRTTVIPDLQSSDQSAISTWKRSKQLFSRSSSDTLTSATQRPLDGDLHNAGNRTVSRRPASAGAPPLGLEESLCNMSSPKPRLIARPVSAASRDTKSWLIPALRSASSGKQKKFVENQENVDPSTPEMQKLLPKTQTTLASNYGPCTPDRGHISPSTAGKTCSPRDMPLALTPDFAPLGHAQQFWQKRTRSSLSFGDPCSPNANHRRPLTPL